MRFFLLDKITRWEPGRLAERVKNVALSEDYFGWNFSSFLSLGLMTTAQYGAWGFLRK